MDDKRPEPPEEDDTYVIDDTGDLKEVGQQLIDEALSKKKKPAAGDRESSEELEALRTETQKLRDQVLRSRADFENFRKRAEKEKADYFKYALSGTMRDLLPVVDNLERALSHDDGTAEFHKGIELIHKQFLDLLQKYGVKPVGDTNVPFDPAVHEAVMREEAPGVPPNTVTEVFQKGYLLNDRLVRPAMVKVSVGSHEDKQS